MVIDLRRPAPSAATRAGAIRWRRAHEYPRPLCAVPARAGGTTRPTIATAMTASTRIDRPGDADGTRVIGDQATRRVMLKEVEDARADHPAERRERGEVVHRLHVQAARAQPARRRDGADEDAQRDREPVPRRGQRSELDPWVNVDRDDRHASHPTQRRRLERHVGAAGDKHTLGSRQSNGARRRMCARAAHVRPRRAVQS